MNKKLIINDFILISAILIVCVFSAIKMYFPASSDINNGYIEVVYDNSLYGTYSLSEDKEISINDLGVTIQIKGKTAKITRSDCPDKFCIASAKIGTKSPDGASIVCLPNKVAIIKRSEQAGKGVDTVAG